MADRTKIIGIDLGTTNSAVAVMEGSKPKVIHNSQGNTTTPSIVAFLQKGDTDQAIGETAKNQAITNAQQTISSIKRFMGKQYANLQSSDKAHLSYTITKGPNDRVEVKVGEKSYTPEQISSYILREMKTIAENYLGHPVKKAVITVPAYFNDAERQATKDAGKLAGLEVERIINEPTAAALAYGLDKKDKEAKIAVFDLGGGTFDISILELGDSIFDVKSTNGDVRLGGDNFDEKIIEWIVSAFKAEQGIDLKKDTMALQRIKQAAEEAKKALSNTTSYDFNLPFITSGASGPIHLQKTLTRAKFEGLIEELVQRTLVPCKNALKDAGLGPKDIDEVILVGGSTRIPRIQQAVKEFFGKEPSKQVNPDEAVALGAAIQAGVLTGEVQDVLLLDVTPISVGIETMGGIYTRLIEKNTTIPTKKSQIFSTAQDNQPSVDILVYQGEREMAADNRFLGKFELGGIPPARRGVPQIEVTFDVDADGILNVSAKDQGTNKENTIRIEGASSLSEEEIAKMEKEASENAKKDKEKRAKAEKVNQADVLIATTERQLEELKDKLDGDTKKEMEEAVAALKKAHEAKDLDAIEKGTEELNAKWKKASEAIYAAKQQEQASGNPDTKSSTQADEGQPHFQEAEEVKDEDTKS